MLQKEFEDRTGVKVSPDEYSAIDAVYMASDIDKDSFCKIWCKMNKSRVKKSAEDLKLKEQGRIIKDSLIEIRNKISSEMYKGGKLPLTVSFLSKKELTLLKYIGIEIQISSKEMVDYGYAFQRYHNIAETRYNLEKYLNIDK